MNCGGSPDFGGMQSEEIVVPVQTRLRTTEKYTYTDNRFNGSAGYLALWNFRRTGNASWG